MPKLPVVTSRQLIKKLTKLGFVKDHTTGSHIIFFHEATRRRAVVPYHPGDLPPGTTHAILKEANISREELLSA